MHSKEKLQLGSALHSLFILSLAACANNQPAYTVSIPMARSHIMSEQTKDTQKFEVHYQLNDAGEKIHRLVNSSAYYDGSDRETYEEIQAEAEKRMILNAIDQVNGVFISAKTEITSTVLTRDKNINASTDLHDKTISKLFGFAKVTNKNCFRENHLESKSITRVICKGLVRVPVVKVVKTEL